MKGRDRSIVAFSRGSVRSVIRRAFCAAALLVAWSSDAAAGVWPTEVDRLDRMLAASEPGDRRAAASRLSSLPAHLAAPLAEKALADPDPEVRLAAAAAVVTHHLRGVEDGVVPWLAEPDVRLRLAACQVVRQRPSEKAVVALSRVLGDVDARVRQAAASALGNAGSNEAVVALLGRLDDPMAEVRVAVVDSLLRLGDARAVVPLLGKVQDGAPEVRRAVARALGDLGDPKAASALVLLLRDLVPDVRLAAIAALGSLHEPGSVLALAPLTDAKTPADVRRAAMSAMGAIGGPRATQILVAALDRDDLGAGAAPARDALVRQGDAALPALLTVIGAPSSERAAAAAAEALGAIGAKSARDPIVRALRRGTLAPVPALRALAMLGDPEAAGVVLERISDGAPAVRAEARRAADALLSPARPNGLAVDPLSAALADAHAPVSERAALVRLLGKTGAPRAAKVVAGLTRGTPLAMRLAAVDALGMLGLAGEDAALLAALDDESPEVRARAGAAAGAALATASVAALVARAVSADAQDRSALASALAGALARADGPTLTRVVAALADVDGRMRDALIEGLGRSSSPEALAGLQGTATSSDRGDRRKAAEALAGHATARGLVRTMLADADASVRANAAWSLIAIASADDHDALVAALGDPSVAVAANAATALGRLASGGGTTEPALCAALVDGRAHVRAAALTGLRVAGARCDAGDAERALLVDDPSPLVRAAAAELLHARPAGPEGRDARALGRCRREDPFGRVATRCDRARPAVSAREPVSVVVVREGESQPAVEAPFALVFADGTVRHGTTDRRGVVFEPAAPRGSVALDVPAVLSR